MSVIPTPSSGRPLRRQEFSDSLFERALARFGGWQMSLAPGQRASDLVEVRDAGGVVVHRTEGAPLGSDEADVFTWVLARWARGGLSEDGVLKTTLYEIVKAMNGDRRLGGRDYDAVAKAITNLYLASITVTDFSEGGIQQKGDASPSLFSDRRLIVQIDYGEHLRKLRAGEDVAAQLVGGMRDETIVVHVAPWLVKRLRQENRRVWLDFAVQRKLGAGMGKRLYVYVEAFSGFEPVPDRDDVEQASIELTDLVYAELGARCKERWDNRKAVRRGLVKLLEIDGNYLGGEDGSELFVGQNGSPDLLKLVRRRRDSVALAA
jgi:hypothetical protein